MRQFITLAQNLLVEGPETEERLRRAQGLGYDTSRVWYHGSNTAFGSFSHDHVGLGNDQNGSGFYFTSSPEDAGMYAGITSSEAKQRTGNSPNIMPVFLRLRQAVPLDSCLKREHIRAIIEAADEDHLWNFGDISHEGRAAVLNKAVKSYADLYGREAMNALNNDFYRGEEGEFLRVFTRVTGMNYLMPEQRAGIDHCVMFLPSDIRSIHAAFLDDKSGDLMA